MTHTTLYYLGVADYKNGKVISVILYETTKTINISTLFHIIQGGNS